MNNVGFSPLLPLSTNKIHYDMIFDITSNIQQNFKNLLLTAPGERIMIPEFGVGIRNFLFEMNISETFEDIAIEIEEQVSLYMPYIDINNIFRLDQINGQEAQENQLGIGINYSVPSLGIVNTIVIEE